MIKREKKKSHLATHLEGALSKLDCPVTYSSLLLPKEQGGALGPSLPCFQAAFFVVKFGSRPLWVLIVCEATPKGFYGLSLQGESTYFLVFVIRGISFLFLPLCC